VTTAVYHVPSPTLAAAPVVHATVPFPVEHAAAPVVDATVPFPVVDATVPRPVVDAAAPVVHATVPFPVQRGDAELPLLNMGQLSLLLDALPALDSGDGSPLPEPEGSAPSLPLDALPALDGILDFCLGLPVQPPYPAPNTTPKRTQA